MRHDKPSPSRPSRKRVNRLRRLGDAALFAGVRAAAAAAGSALVSLAVWWIIHHP